MAHIELYLKRLQDEEERLQKENESRQLKLNISKEQFKEMFLKNANISIHKRGENRKFAVDDSNREVVNQLFFYITGNEKFKGKFNKGILLAGSVGVGKTVIMNAFCNIYDELSGKIITRTSAKRIDSLIAENAVGHFDKRPLFIDDLGREKREVTTYGTKETPLLDLFFIRYDFGALTLATTNFKLEKLEEFYGEAVMDRFKEMFNIIVITGNSKRE